MSPLSMFEWEFSGNRWAMRAMQNARYISSHQPRAQTCSRRGYETQIQPMETGARCFSNHL
jgi:hypothetical protein